MISSNTEMRPITDTRPEIYFTVFLKIIITLNVIGVAFRILGSIFMLIFVRISNKIKKRKIISYKFLESSELNEVLYTKKQHYNTINPLKYDSIQSFSSGTMKTTSHTFIETKRPIFHHKTASLIDYDSKRIPTSGYDTEVRVTIKDKGNDEKCKIKGIKEESIQNQNYDKAPFLSYSYISENNQSKEELFQSFFETPKRKSLQISGES